MRSQHIGCDGAMGSACSWPLLRSGSRINCARIWERNDASTCGPPTGREPVLHEQQEDRKTLLRTDLIAKRTATRCDALWTMVCDSSAMLHSSRVMAMSALPYLWSVSQPRSAARCHSRETARRRRSRIPRRSTPARCDGRYREAKVDAIHEVDHRRPAAGTIFASSPVSVAIPTAYRTCGGGYTLQSKTCGS
ncbi:hypothetical protein B0G74_6368 [Paraburkholderia sp. BL9I2N2]|jgi:hypothetical protein|nr:hypothetical protein B0G74_6368 [Paraburkholderia sp. BL9I2N2]